MSLCSSMTVHMDVWLCFHPELKHFFLVSTPTFTQCLIALLHFGSVLIFFINCCCIKSYVNISTEVKQV